MDGRAPASTVPKEEARLYLNIRDSHGEKGVEKIESDEWKMRLC